MIWRSIIFLNAVIVPYYKTTGFHIRNIQSSLRSRSSNNLSSLTDGDSSRFYRIQKLDKFAPIISSQSPYYCKLSLHMSGHHPLWMSTSSNSGSSSIPLSEEDEAWSSSGDWGGILHDDGHDDHDHDDLEEAAHEDVHDDDHHHDDEDSNDDSLLEEYEVWTKALDDTIQALDRKRNALQSELTKAQGVEDTVSRAQLLVSNLYMFTPGVKSATVQDWENDGIDVELVLDPKYDTASAEADALFAQARKLKRGSEVVSNLLDDTAKAWDLLQEAKLDLSSTVDNIIIDEGRFIVVQDRLKRTSGITNFSIPTSIDLEGGRGRGRGRNQKQQSRQQSKGNNRKKPALGSPASNVRKLISPGGCTIFVGRNRRGNEHLSLSVARGNDIWMHSRGCPGAHVIIVNRRGGPTPTSDCLQLGADLAIFYSDFRTERKAPVLAAEPKHLLKPRGAPLGAIKVRQEWKTFIGMPDNVPIELKELREESGQSDEYRSFDKAKHRQRTKRAAKEAQLKRKRQREEKKNQ